MRQRTLFLSLCVCICFFSKAQTSQLEIGITLSQKGNHQEASKIFTEILTNDPGNLYAKLELSRERMYLGE